MKAMILAYESPADFEKRRSKSAYEAYMTAWRTYSEGLAKAGVLVSCEALEGPETATCISTRDGRRFVEDGPFTDSKEQLGGFFMINVASLDEATRLAAECPAAETGRVEIWMIPDYGQGT
jgi:hypothetical protein